MSAGGKGKAFPSTGLANLAVLLLKAQEREASKPPVDTTEVDVLDVIAAGDMPAERKKKALKEELRRVEERHHKVSEALEELAHE